MHPGPLLHQIHCFLLGAAVGIGLLLFVGCSDSDRPLTLEPPTFELPFRFADGFETPTAELDDLFPADNSRWTAIQWVDPGTGANAIELTTELASEGSRSLRMLAQPSDAILSKMDVEKQGFFAPEGSTVTLAADFYLTSEANLGELFLIDLECCACWDPSVPDNQCPGIRLKLSGEPGYLAIERGKILGTTLNQRELPFPRRQWVSVVWQMRLSPGEAALNSLLVDGKEVINATGKNLPNAAEFTEAFADAGVDFSLQTPLGYERVQIGATANPTDQVVELFVDNFSIVVE